MENVMGKLEEKLSAPSSEYRSVPFWSWNDELDLNELQWQIHEMKEKGISGCCALQSRCKQSIIINSKRLFYDNLQRKGW